MNMEGPGQNYRKKLAEEIKAQPDPEKRREALVAASATTEYQEAKQQKGHEEGALTPEKLQNLQTLETTVEADFGPLLERINAELGLHLTPRPDGYHITIISPPEGKVLTNLTSEQIQQLQEINRGIQKGEGIKITGIGFIDGSKQDGIRDADKEKKTCFLSLDAPTLQEFRRSVGLPEKDLHVTLGFEGGDIHMEITGKNEKGKDVLRPIEKKANSAFDKYISDLPEVKYTTLSGQEKQKPKSKG